MRQKSIFSVVIASVIVIFTSCKIQDAPGAYLPAKGRITVEELEKQNEKKPEHWDNLYKHRVYIERTIFTLKDCFGLNSLKTHNTLTIKADVYLAAITQLIGVILAKELHELKLYKSVRKLIKKVS
mgnify:CR=1 FL=1